MQLLNKTIIRIHHIYTFVKIFPSTQIDIFLLIRKILCLYIYSNTIDLPENEFNVFISLRAAYCAGNNLDFIVSKAIQSIKPGGVILFSISNGYIDVSDGKYTPIKGVYNPQNQHCDETETERNINWMKTAMLANGCSNVTIIDAESEILLISKR